MAMGEDAVEGKPDVPVLVSIRGSTRQGDGEEQKVHLTTEGRLFRAPDEWRVEYRESPVTGMDGTLTTLRIGDDGSVRIDRTGTHVMRMDLRKGYRHVTHMTTPFGSMDLGVCTTLLEPGMGPEGGHLQLGYTVEFHNLPPLHTRLSISVRRTANPLSGDGPAGSPRSDDRFA